MIPKSLHRIWLGPKPIPEYAERYWQRFRAMHPGWEMRTWTDEDDYSFLANRDLFEQAATWTSKSDVLRFEVLNRFGGIYVDTDIEPLKSFEPVLGRPFAGYEEARVLCGAVLGSEAGHPAIRALVEALPGWVSGRSVTDPSTWAGPRFLTAQWSGRDDVELYPTETFYPVHWRQGSRQRVMRGTLAIHHWKKSWEAVHEPSLSICMAWLDKGDAYRNRVKDWVERFWRSAFPDAEFVVAGDPREPFNRSACFNRAVERSSGELLFTLDADCLLGPSVIRDGLRFVQEQRCWVVPWHSTWRMTEEATSLILDREPETYTVQRPTNGSFSGREHGIGLKFAGFCNVMRREAWELVGGMDERFEGWGSEDIGFSLALDTLYGPHLVPRSDALHLYHHRPMTQGTLNARLELDYWQASGKPEAMRKLLGIDAQTPDPQRVYPPTGWISSDSLRRRPGQVPPNRVRMLQALV